jgi:hypothetical protein
METRNNSLLENFIVLIEQIPQDIVNAAIKHSNDEDEKAIINSFAPTVINQFKEVAAHLTEISGTAPKQKMADAEKFLKLSSGVTLASNLKLALPSIGSIIGKLGIDGIIKEIKKIITTLLEIFHINLPDWVLPLVNLIDEIIADILGGGIIKVKTALSQAEQNYLAELTQLAKLQKANRGLNINTEEE